jgi:hypothetical protein
MDNLEASNPPQKQEEMVQAQCWECGEHKICYEYIVCCTGTRFHTCKDCEERLINEKI